MDMILTFCVARGGAPAPVAEPAPHIPSLDHTPLAYRGPSPHPLSPAKFFPLKSRAAGTLIRRDHSMQCCGPQARSRVCWARAGARGPDHAARIARPRHRVAHICRWARRRPSKHPRPQPLQTPAVQSAGVVPNRGLGSICFCAASRIAPNASTHTTIPCAGASCVIVWAGERESRVAVERPLYVRFPCSWFASVCPRELKPLTKSALCKPCS